MPGGTSARPASLNSFRSNQNGLPKKVELVSSAWADEMRLAQHFSAGINRDLQMSP